MAAVGPPATRKSRPRRDVVESKDGSKLNVDELRAARTSYYTGSIAGGDRTARRASRRATQSGDMRNDGLPHDRTASKVKDRVKSTDSSGDSKRHVHARRRASSGGHVYEQGPLGRKTDQADVVLKSNSYLESPSPSKSGYAKRSLTQRGTAARPLRRSATPTSQSKHSPARPTTPRNGSTSAATSKEGKRRSILSSLFRSTSMPQEKSVPRTVECLTCGSDGIPIDRSAKLSCGHRMCKPCLKRIFTLSVKDPSHMPPRCCSSDHIPLKYADDLFDSKFKQLWNTKYQEYTTKNRLYCPMRDCGAWIKPTRIHSEQGRKHGICGKCKTRCCARCNSKIGYSSLGHQRGHCPAAKDDEESRKFFETAREEGWQRCPSCKAMVELEEGCHHITCRCTAEWCFVCTKTWRTCECPWFNYRGVPDADRLNHMRIPDIVPPIRRHNSGGAAQPEPASVTRSSRNIHNSMNPALRYQQEADVRREQLRRDEMLARHLLLNDVQEDGPPRRQSVSQEVFGNAGEHFLNENFVRESANVDETALRDAAFGQRGERSSGRRTKPSDARYGSLGPNPFGTESLLGLCPPPPVASRRDVTLRSANDGPRKRQGGDLIGRWLSKLG